MPSFFIFQYSIERPIAVFRGCDSFPWTSISKETTLRESTAAVQSVPPLADRIVHSTFAGGIHVGPSLAKWAVH
jgi:hypothetical protein